MELNPFNILNVYADCSAKELAASKARLTAFTSVGKVVKDLVVSASGEKQHNITTAQIQAAYNTLQQPSNKISYALLWFFKPEVDDLRELLEHGTVSEIACGFEYYYDIFMKTSNMSGLKDDYNKALVNKDREVLVLDPRGQYKGRALGIDDEGSLLVRQEDGNVSAVISGEVSVRGIYGYV